MKQKIDQKSINSNPENVSDVIFKELERYAHRQTIPVKYIEILKQFYLGYKEALYLHGIDIAEYKDLFSTYIKLIEQQCLEPYLFEPFHTHIRKPFDHYRFGLDMFKPLIDRNLSTMTGLEHLQKAVSLLEKGDNVIFFANHQIEGDPQVISLFLEERFPHLAENLIFVAGERVITDPLAIPLSMGCNLLCIYSKRYIDLPPENKLKKQLHNKKTMQLMSELLSEGGKAIYVAPSGGRDRPNSQGVFEVAAFDPQSIEMFYLMATRAGHPTHFLPLVLKTYALLPPPENIQVELGEVRLAKRSGIHLAFGPAFDMEHFPGSDISVKHQRRQARADYIWKSVDALYQKFPN
jgi:glycerol-3-phosphate O-acyltransferase